LPIRRTVAEPNRQIATQDNVDYHEQGDERH
jgi:hypothetical protein